MMRKAVVFVIVKHHRNGGNLQINKETKKTPEPKLPLKANILQSLPSPTLKEVLCPLLLSKLRALLIL